MCATLRPLCLLSQRFSQLHLQHLPAPRSGGKEGPELLVQLWCCSQFHSPLQRSVSKAMGRAQLWSQGSKQLPRTVPAANAGSGGEGKGSAKSGTVSPWEEWKHRMLPWEHRNNQRCFSLSWRSPGAAAPPEEGERANPEEEREQTPRRRGSKPEYCSELEESRSRLRVTPHLSPAVAAPVPPPCPCSSTHIPTFPWQNCSSSRAFSSLINHLLSYKSWQLPQ